jgi:hypothetical protein
MGGMKICHASVIFALTFVLAPATAQAQQEFLKDKVTKIMRKVGVHGNMSVREPLDHDFTKGTTFGGSIGLAPGRTNGWRYPFGFTTFSENMHTPDGTKFAVFESVAVLGGVGYGWHFMNGKLSTGASVQGGWGFNHGSLVGNVAQAFGVPDGPSSIHIANTPLLRPQIRAEYFLTEKFTLRTSADYMLLRPGVAVITSGIAQPDHWHASNFHANFGIGFYPFRK